MSSQMHWTEWRGRVNFIAPSSLRLLVSQRKFGRNFFRETPQKELKLDEEEGEEEETLFLFLETSRGGGGGCDLRVL